MPCCETNVVCSCNHTNELANQYCHPYLRENLKDVTPAETNNGNCMQNRYTCNSYCYPEIQEGCMNQYHEHFQNVAETEQEKHLHCVSHSCPLGKVICCTDCKKNDCKNDTVIKSEDIRETKGGIIRHAVHPQEPASENMSGTRERPCCAKNTSWTEPRICRCDPCDPTGYMRCGCECGAAIVTEPPKEKPKKTVRFADEVLKPEDCEKAFRNLDIEDVKHLCCCCQECAVIGKEQCIGKPVLVYELPEPKLEDRSVTQKDFCWQKMSSREVPPWHPNIKDRWRHMDVPSLCETTYQYDYRPPPVVACPDRKPVYLAPKREKIDPCQQLAEEYRSWKKTSTGEKHTYHSTCDECDKDLHRVHLHECDVSHLPPQYQCHGDGHICQPTHHAAEEKFIPCGKVSHVPPQYQSHGDGHLCQPSHHAVEEKLIPCGKGDASESNESRYWWKRTCCVPEKICGETLSYLPPDLMKPVCPSYTTSYKRDFKDPQRIQNEKLYFGNCKDCEYCTRPFGEPEPNLLCTKNTRDQFMTQRVEII